MRIIVAIFVLFLASPLLAPDDWCEVWGYADFVEVIQNPDHEGHDGMLAWPRSSFEPFDAIAAREMRRGLPDWRNMP